MKTLISIISSVILLGSCATIDENIIRYQKETMEFKKYKDGTTEIKRKLHEYQKPIYKFRLLEHEK